MFGKCVRSTNTGGDRCSVCGALPSEVHKAGPLLGKRLFCPSCCVGCACKLAPAPLVTPAPSKRSSAQAGSYGPPVGSKDPWYRDERRPESQNANWIPTRKWF
jgi:hypothetical protein